MARTGTHKALRSYPKKRSPKDTKTQSCDRHDTGPCHRESLEILLGEASEQKLAIRDALYEIVSLCPKHDDIPEEVALALQLAESAMLQAIAALERPESTEKERTDSAAARDTSDARLRAALEALSGDRMSLGQQQAFVLSAINYAATQVPEDRAKLARELVLYALWRIDAIPFESFDDVKVHTQAADVIVKWKNAGGRGRSRWEPAQAFLQTFGIAPKNATALKECAEKYGVAYAPPLFEDGSPYVTMNEFDIVSGRFSGCPCCKPKEFDSFRRNEK